MQMEVQVSTRWLDSCVSWAPPLSISKKEFITPDAPPDPPLTYRVHLLFSIHLHGCAGSGKLFCFIHSGGFLLPRPLTMPHQRDPSTVGLDRESARELSSYSEAEYCFSLEGFAHYA